jgi:hypothetical protein
MARSHSGFGGGGATMTQNTEKLVQHKTVSRIMYVKYLILEYTVKIPPVLQYYFVKTYRAWG